MAHHPRGHAHRSAYRRQPLDIVIAGSTINLGASSAAVTSAAVTSAHVTSAAATNKLTSAAATTPVSSPVLTSAKPTSVATTSALSSTPVSSAVVTSKPLTSAAPTSASSAPSSDGTSTDLAESTPSVVYMTTTAHQSASTETTSAAADESKSDLSTPTMVGIVIAAVVVLMGLVSLCFWINRMRKRSDRKALADDALTGMDGVEFGRRSSRRISRAGYSRNSELDLCEEPLEAYQTQHGYEITRPEAAQTVHMQQMYSNVAPPHVRGSATSSQLFVPPHAPFGGSSANGSPRSQSTGMWTDNSEMDVFADHGSTIARTTSTVTRANSEYDQVDHDPGMVMQPPGAAFMGHSSQPSGGTFGRSSAPQSPNSAYTPRTPAPYNPYAVSPNDGGTFLSINGGGNAYPSAVANTMMAPSQLSQAGAYEAQRATSVHDVQPHQQQHQQGPPVLMLASDAALRNGQRIPAPRLMVDTKHPIQWPEDDRRSSATPVAGPSGSPRPPTMMSVHSAHSAAIPASPATGGVRPLVGGGAVRQQSLYHPEEQEVVADHGTPITANANAVRPATIVLHADSGLAFEGLEPATDNQGNLHLPPAYGDIYGPSEPETAAGAAGPVGPAPAAASARR